MKYLLTIFFASLFALNSFSQIKDKEELKKVSNEILTYINKYSIVTDSINWKEFKEDISTKIAQLNDIDSNGIIFSSILNKLRQYGDFHSFYYDKSKSKKLVSNDTTLKYPSSKIIDNSIGYLSLPTHLSMNEKDNSNYADTLRKQIELLDKNYSIKGWVVDLRENRGGNMWPMLAGLNPIIEDGTVGYFVTKGKAIKWKSNSKNTYKCKNLNNRIAILIDTSTASSGEMTAISLLGRKDSKSFGKRTSGYTTANENYKLSNGAMLFLATAYCEDRTKKKYIGKIIPDVEVLENAETISESKKWLLEKK